MSTLEINKSNTSTKRFLAGSIKRWHRRLGLLSACVIIFLSLSGIALNHLSTLYSSQSYISSEWILDWYEVKAPANVYGYPLNMLAVEQQSEQNSQQDIRSDIIWADGSIFVNQHLILSSQLPVIGIKTHQEITYLFTQNAVHLFTLDGDKIESAALGISGESMFEHAFNVDLTENITIAENLVALQTQQQIHLFDLLAMRFVQHPDFLPVLRERDNLNNIRSSTTQDAELAKEFILLKSKVLLDFHSGRFFGQLGPLVMDIFAVSFLLLALSGIYIWTRRWYQRKGY